MATVKSVHPIWAAVAVAALLLASTPAADLAQAVAAQRALVEARPGDAGVLNDLGNLLVESGADQEAEEAYRRAMQMAPEMAEAPYNLALLLASENRPREAKRLLQRMLGAHPDHAWGHYQLGTLHQASGARGKALGSYREAFRLDPSLIDPRRNPHVVDNGLATAAMLEAFALAAPAATSQRIYVEPRRITGLLLPPLTATPAEPQTETEPETAEGEPAAEGEEEPLEEVEVTEEPGG